MIILPVQFEAFRTRSDGSRILSLSIYPEYASDVSEVINGAIGQEYMVMMIRTNSSEYKDFTDETPDETLARFRRWMNALLTDIANKKGEDKGDFREKFKDTLKQEGKIKSSTNELTLSQLAEIINRLKKYKHDIETKTN
jgi:hypothetical protein